MERIEWTSDTPRAIVSALRERVQVEARRRHDRIEEHIGRHWTSWRSRKGQRIFAEIRPLRGRVQVFILPRPSDLRDAAGLARRAPSSQGWGWFRSRIEVSSMARVGPAARLIVQSYQQAAGDGNGGRMHQRTRRTQGL